MNNYIYYVQLYVFLDVSLNFLIEILYSFSNFIPIFIYLTLFFSNNIFFVELEKDICILNVYL